jgi:hypothetical protein
VEPPSSIVAQGLALSRIIVCSIDRLASEVEMRLAARKFPISEKSIGCASHCRWLLSNLELQSHQWQ